MGNGDIGNSIDKNLNVRDKNVSKDNHSRAHEIRTLTKNSYDTKILSNGNNFRTTRSLLFLLDALQNLKTI